MPDQYTYQEFAAVMRDLYPELALPEVPDDELTSAIISTHPAFKPHVVDPGPGGMRGAIGAAQELLAPPPAPPRRKNRDIVLEPEGPPDPRLMQRRQPAAPPAPSTVIQPPPAKYYNAEAGMEIDDNPGALSALRDVVQPGVQKMIRGAQAVFNPPPDQPNYLSEVSGAIGYPGRTWMSGGDARSQALIQQPYAREGFTGGVSDILEGGMEAGTPLVPPALAVAPVPTLVGLGVGAAAQYGTEYGLQQLDVDPDLQRLGGIGAGLIAGAAAVSPPTLRGARVAGEWTRRAARRVTGLRTPTPSLTPTLDSLPLRQAEVGGPIRALDEFEYDPTLRPAPPPRVQKQLPPPRGVGPNTIIAGTPDAIAATDFTGPTAPTRFAASVPDEFPPDVNTIGELVGTTLENSRPQATPTLVDPLTRGELRLRPPVPPNRQPVQGSMIGGRRGLGVNQMAAVEGRIQQTGQMGGARDIPGQNRLPFQDRTLPPSQRGHMPEEWDAFQEVLDLMESQGYKATDWEWLGPNEAKETGKYGDIPAAGGNARLHPGHGGARVFWDIVNEFWAHEPESKVRRVWDKKKKAYVDTPVKNSYTPSRDEVIAGMRAYMEGRRSVWGERAMRVAQRRAAAAKAEAASRAEWDAVIAEEDARLGRSAPEPTQGEGAPLAGEFDDLPPGLRGTGQPEVVEGGFEPDLEGTIGKAMLDGEHMGEVRPGGPPTLKPRGAPVDDLPAAFRDIPEDGLPEPGGWEPDESQFRRGGSGDEPPQLSQAGGARKTQLEALATDEAMGTQFPENEASHFPNGDEAVNCTNCAKRIIEMNDGQGEIYGWEDGTNPTSVVSGPTHGAMNDRGQGHDFAVIDGRYLVDAWAKNVEMSSDRAVFDLNDPADVAEVRRLFGDPTKWVKAERVGERFRGFKPGMPEQLRQPALPGAEAVRGVENASPEMEAPFSLEKPVSKAPDAVQETLFGEPPPSPGFTVKGRRKGVQAIRDLFSEEEGALVLDVAPGDKAALQKWLHRQRKEYGGEEWHRAASDALKEGNTLAAWRIASMAAGAGAPGVAGSRKAVKAAGGPPSLADKRVTVGEGGILRPPESFLKKPSANLMDDNVGRTVVNDMLNAVDPSQVIIVPGNTNRDLRIFSQAADQLLRTMDKDVVREYSRALGVPPEQAIGHFKRSISRAGKLLSDVSKWRAEHLDEMTILDRLAGGSDGLPTTGAPPSLAGLSPAQRAARVRKARAVAHMAETLDQIVKDGTWYDKRAASWALTKSSTARGESLPDAFENMSRAFIVSKSSTAIRNLWTQAGRYGVGAVDEMGAAMFAELGGDRVAAAKHLRMARELVRATTRQGAGARHPTASTMQGIYDYTEATLRGMSPNDVRKSLAILDKFPQHSAEYLGSMAESIDYGAKADPATGKRTQVMGAPGRFVETKNKILGKLLDPKLRNQVTVMNRLQEFTTRSAVFDAALRTELAARGVNPTELYMKPFGDIVKQVGAEELDLAVSTATHTALDYTFASSPYPGSVPSLLLHTFSRIPILSPLLRTTYPFPRFNFVAAPRFIYDHSPMALFDLMRMPLDLVTGDNPHKGRLFLGMTGKKIETSLLPAITQELTGAQIREGTALQSHLSSRVAAAKAARGLKALEKQMGRVKDQAELPTLEGRYKAQGEEMQALLVKGQEAKQAYLAAQQHTRALQRERAELRTKLSRIKSIGAPSLAQYVSRQAVGATMFSAALLMRASDQADGTDWYEYKVNVPGAGTRTVDLRPFAPFVQYMLPADVVMDVYKETDWDQVHADMQGLDHVDPQTWAETLGKHYHGKYTGERAGNEMINAFLSISQAAGTTLSFIDLWQGKGTSQGKIADVKNTILGTVGQFLGRFTVPLQMVNEVQGQLETAGGRYEASQARIPEGPTAENRATGDMLFGPTVANTPGLRETIPPTVSPLSGQPLATVDPLARTLAGITQRVRGRFEEELQRTGLPYYRAVPRRTGDRAFDNQVAKAYAAALNENLDDVLSDPDYVKAPTDLKRELLGSAMSSLRVAAYEKVASEMGDEKLAEKLERPGDRHRRERWETYLDTLETEYAKEEPPAAPEPSAADPSLAPPPGLRAP